MGGARRWIAAFCLAAGLCGVASTATGPSPPPIGVTILSKALDLEFQTPKGWRLAIESTENQLLLYGHGKRITPLLRVRVFNGGRSPIERMPEMIRVLADAEAQVKTVSADRWQHEGRSFQTARAVVKDGPAEYIALFTLVDQPKRVQHGFWLYGKTKDVEKHWPAIQASIASAKSIGVIGRPGADEEEEAEEPESEAPDVWTHPKTRLAIKQWPEEFALDESSKDQFTTTGLLLKPTDDRAHASTSFRVSALLAQEKDAAEKASETLAARLKGDASARGFATVSVRVAGLPASKNQWSQEAPDGPFVHEVYFFQKDTTLYQVEFTAAQAWARTRSRRTLVRDFIAGIRL